MRPPAPWWCCFGWHPRSLICLADNLGHALRRHLPTQLADLVLQVHDPICEAHDRWITKPPLGAIASPGLYRLSLNDSTVYPLTKEH